MYDEPKHTPGWNTTADGGVEDGSATEIHDINLDAYGDWWSPAQMFNHPLVRPESENYGDGPKVKGESPTESHRYQALTNGEPKSNASRSGRY